MFETRGWVVKNWYFVTTPGAMDYVHNEQANVLFLDGNVVAMKEKLPLQIWLSDKIIPPRN